MKKKIVGICIMTLLVTITFVPANVIGLQLSKTADIVKEYNQNEPVFEPKFSDYIYFKTWGSDEFDSTGGYGSTILGNHIYLIVGLSDDGGGYSVNNHIGVLKYDKDDGSLIDSIVVDSPHELSPRDIVAYKNHIYLLGQVGDYDYDNHALIKLDTDLNVVIYSKISRLGYAYFKPQKMTVGTDGIYIGGEIKGVTDGLDIFLAKFDEDCNLVWDEYSVWERDDSQYLEEGGLGVHNGFIYMSGEGFLIKFSSTGALVKTLILPYSLWGTAIAAYGDKIYVCFMKYVVVTVDLLIAAYDEDLNEQWSRSFNKGSYFDKAYSVVATSDFLYIGGAVCNIDMSISGFVLKFDLGTKKEAWYKEIGGRSGAISLVKEGNYLYVSGMILGSSSVESFLMKCDLDWGKCIALDGIVQNTLIARVLERIVQKFKNIF
jgi:hypothetical protein